MAETKNPWPSDQGHSKHFDSTSDSYRGTHGGRVRAHDPETSWAVAPIAYRALSDLQDNILGILSVEAMHDGGLVRAYQEGGHPRRSPQRIVTARAELVARGLVANTGRTALSEYGNASIVWEVLP